MKKKIDKNSKKKVVDIKELKIRKDISEQTDPNCEKAVDDFLKKFKNDTLTGF